MISSGLSTVVNDETIRSATATTRLPRGVHTKALASSRASAEIQSAAGSACARLPPIVPRLRTAR